MYKLTLTNPANGATIERDLDVTTCLDVMFLIAAIATTAVPYANPGDVIVRAEKRHYKKRKVRTPKDDGLDEPPPKPKIDKELIRTLLKTTDASVADIAKRAKCSPAYVHLIRAKMQRDGVL